jgi:hypothetical protein
MHVRICACMTHMFTEIAAKLCTYVCHMYECMSKAHAHSDAARRCKHVWECVFGLVKGIWTQ